jgi:pentatricopeptide repeat domain-containing protein 1
METKFGVKPTTVSYSAAISACEKGEPAQWALALQLLVRMGRANITADVVCFSAAISACGRGRQWERAVSLLRTMQHGGNIDTGDSNNSVWMGPVKPNTVSFTAAIGACGNAGEWEEALKLLEEMRPQVETNSQPDSWRSNRSDWGGKGKGKGKGGNSDNGTTPRPNEVTCNVVITVLGKGGQWGRIPTLLKEMVAQPSGGGKYGYGVKLKTLSYNMAISVCAKGGQWEHALQILHSMGGGGSSARVDGAPEPDTITYNAAMSACEKAREWERALELLQQLKAVGAKSASRSISNLAEYGERVAAPVQPNRISYNTAISGCAKEGMWKKAIELMDEMWEAVGGKNLGEGTHWSDSTDSGSRGAKGGNSADMLRPDVITYAAVVSACCRAEPKPKLVRAFKLFEELRLELRLDDALDADEDVEEDGYRGYDGNLEKEKAKERAKEKAEKVSAEEEEVEGGERAAQWRARQREKEMSSVSSVCYELKQACGRAGELKKAEKVQRLMARLGVKELQPLATFELPVVVSADTTTSSVAGGDVIAGNAGVNMTTNGEKDETSFIIDDREHAPPRAKSSSRGTKRQAAGADAAAAPRPRKYTHAVRDMVVRLQSETEYTYDLTALPALYMASEENLWNQKTDKVSCCTLLAALLFSPILYS